MDFRRIPFQFTSTDPAKRQAELEKRFGLTDNKDKMYIDFGSPGHMGSRKYESNSTSTSPRLQHRVPIFTEGAAETSPHHDTQPNNVDVGRKPRVRVVPIEIEGAETTKRHRHPSGPSYVDRNPLNGHFLPEEVIPSTKPPVRDAVSGVTNKPRVCNIPIKIEGSPKKTKESHCSNVSSSKKEIQPKHPVQQNGCNVSKTNDNAVKKREASPEPDFNVSLKKIETVLEKLKGYEAEVEKFAGTTSEKQYRYLDEMLTRCMLDLDDVDTMGNEDVRLARKAAIKKVQYCIDLLESKVNGGNSPEESTIVEASAGSETLVEDSVSKVEDIDMVPSEEMANAVEKTEGSSVDPVPTMADVNMTPSDEVANQTKEIDVGKLPENPDSMAKEADIDMVPSEENTNQTDKNEPVKNVDTDSTENRAVIEISELETEDVEMEENLNRTVIKSSEVLIEEPVEVDSVGPMSQVMELDQQSVPEIQEITTEGESCSTPSEELIDNLQHQTQTDVDSSENKNILLESSVSHLETEETSERVASCDRKSECDVDSKDTSDVKCAVVNEMPSVNNDISNSLNTTTQSNADDTNEHSKNHVKCIETKDVEKKLSKY